MKDVNHQRETQKEILKVAFTQVDACDVKQDEEQKG